MDYSFLKLYTSIEASLDFGDYKNTQLGYAKSIQLSPNEVYAQMTNVDGGISFDSNYDIHIVDSCNNELKDISNNVFTEEFYDINGVAQVKIEIVNIGEDFGGRAVHIRFKNTAGDDSWFTRPIKITDFRLNDTIRLDYTNTLSLEGLTYEKSSLVQSIRIACEYSKPINNSEAGQYYKISDKNTISTRFLSKLASEYRCNTIDIFTYERLQKVFEHDTIYLDGVRVTDNPIVQPSDRIGYTNETKCTFVAYRDKNDTFAYDFQVFEGVNYVSFTPYGYYVTGTTFTEYTINFSENIELGTGTVLLYNDANTLIETFTESDMSVLGNTLTIDVTGSSGASLSDDVYYLHVSSGLVTFIGVSNEAINDSTTWTFTLSGADYDATDYDSDDYFAN